ncbi:MAG: dihydrolipoamide acetyltransferase family protein [Bacteroidetes bacterium]|nr:dihydrolipoamide acetyltransferase family protein [Bacteroidota bacterium]MDA0903637.1 dihydrolipoamide acetyltransferase family protein [Bacteroidota bacterium]MDA1242609.1 dihydrolipoamide acetyltransferase family protein [Bacteroidota bacterium]
MAIIDILLPKMGESVAEATITKLVVDPGAAVDADDPIVEIATDKVDSEVPAPEDGTLVEWCVAEGDVVQVGAVIARYDVGGEAVGSGSTTAPASVANDSQPQAAHPNTPPAEVLQATMAPLEEAGAPARKGPSGRFYSPLVRSIAEKEGMSMAELEAIQGSGSEGRVTKKDILAYVANRGAGSVGTAVQAPAPTPASTSAPAPAPALSSSGNTPATSVSGAYDIVEMDRMRKMIADHMVRSVATSPHVTSFVEADVTNMVHWRNANKKAFEQKFGEKLTFTPLIAEAIVKAIRDFPGVNASVDGDKILIHKAIHLGMAAALPSGNLIVPVIKHADQYNLQGLARQVNDLANRARLGKLSPDDIQGGTYTMSNVGTFGNVMGTPIINQPQVGILALGAIRKRPAVLETAHGDVIAIRHMMFLSHSYDHRVVDGMLGGSFVRRVADFLEGFDPQRPLEG